MATRLGKGLLRRLRLLFCRASSSGVAGGLGSRRAGGRCLRPKKGRTGGLGPPVPPSDPPRGAPAPSGGAPRRDLQFQLEIAMSSSRLLSANRWAALDAARGAAGAAGGGGGPARGGPPPPRDPGIRRPRRTTRPAAAAKPVSPSGQPGDSLPREREAGTRTLFSRKRDGVQVRSPSAPRGRAGGPPSPDCWRLAPRARDPGPRAPARGRTGGGGGGPSPSPWARPGPGLRPAPARARPGSSLPSHPRSSSSSASSSSASASASSWTGSPLQPRTWSGELDLRCRPRPRPLRQGGRPVPSRRGRRPRC